MKRELNLFVYNEADWTFQPHPSFNNSTYLPNGQSAPGGNTPAPGAVPLLPNQGRVIQNGPTRVLCVADVRGRDGFYK